jgi:galactokinase/mevalonate kinase-like predicted kinase
MPRRLAVSAPGRAGILGNPTDQYGGSQISCSVNLRARVTLAEAPALVLAAAHQECPVASPRALELQGDLFDLARAVLAEVGPLRPPCRIEWTSEIPLQGGLAGSTALLAALLKACLVWQRRDLGPHALAELARRIEATRLGVVCGFGDQYMAVFGGLRYLDFRGKAHGEVFDPPRYATVEALDALVPALPFALGVTGVQHRSGSVHRPIRERWLAGDPEVVGGYARMGELARAGKVALLTGDLLRFGALMNENHDIQRSFGGSGASNETLIAAALAAGALGAKLAGAGDGGTVIALWPEADVTPLERALCAAGAVATPKLLPVAGMWIEEDSMGETDKVATET